jgi:hypothetical protein
MRWCSAGCVARDDSLARERVKRYSYAPGQRDRASLEHNRAITTIHRVSRTSIGGVLASDRD